MTDAPSSCVSFVVRVLGAFVALPASRLIRGDVIGDGAFPELRDLPFLTAISGFLSGASEDMTRLSSPCEIFFVRCAKLRTPALLFRVRNFRVRGLAIRPKITDAVEAHC